MVAPNDRSDGGEDEAGGDADGLGADGEGVVSEEGRGEDQRLAVAQVAVIGLPEDRWCGAVHAIVVIKPDVAATADHLKAHDREADRRLQAAEVDRVPRRAARCRVRLKVLKRELRGTVLGRGKRAVH